MSTESHPPSPAGSHALLALAPVDPNWQPIFQASNQVVLYNPTSHALTIRKSSHVPHRARACPYCKQSLPDDFDFDLDGDIDDDDTALDFDSTFPSRVPNYFQLLAVANETTSLSRPSTPPHIHTEDDTRGRGGGGRGSAFSAEAMAEGYFKAFFKEECRLGMGAYGSVFLCQVSIPFHAFCELDRIISASVSTCWTGTLSVSMSLWTT